MCRRSVVHWFNNWVWTFDPRLAAEGRATILPMDLFPRQVELLRWLDGRLEAREDGILDKSRDIGATWLCAGYATHKWLFADGFKTSIGSRKAELVDRLGDPDSIFEKIRILLKYLPPWMKPRRFVSSFHDNHMRLINPDNDAIIRGEAGDDMGRGGRSSLYLLDEAAHIPQAENVDAATSANTDVRIWISSVNGMGNLFARKRHSVKPEQVFTFHYRDDPRMTADRVANLRAKMEEWAWNAEYEIDYSASVEGICIPSKWVQAAQQIEAACRDRGITIEPAVRGISGLDVGGGGKAKSVHVARFGPIVTPPESWGQPDTTETAHRGLAAASDTTRIRSDGTVCRVAALNFDSVGVGAGVLSALKRARKGIVSVGVNTGDSPSETVWPDGETSQEKFANLKAELWWLARARFKATYEMLLWLRGESGGQEHLPSDVIVLPSSSVSGDVMTLVSQLSLPKVVRNEKGKLQMETKLQMAKRGLPSPDHADAFVLTFVESNVVDTWRKAFGARRR